METIQTQLIKKAPHLQPSIAFHIQQLKAIQNDILNGGYSLDSSKTELEEFLKWKYQIPMIVRFMTNIDG